GADEHDVLRRDLGLQLGVEPAPAVVVAQGDGHGALGLGLADDVAVELGDDLRWRQSGRLARELRRRAVWSHGEVRAGGTGVEGVHQAPPSSATGSPPQFSGPVAPAALTVRTVALPLVKTSISAAIARAARAIASASMSVCRSSAVAAARQSVYLLVVGDVQNGLEVGEGAVRPPLLHGLAGGAREVAAVGLEVALELVQEREGVGDGPGEAGDDGAVGEGAHLDRAP